MKIKYDVPKGFRVNYEFFDAICDNFDYCWSYETNRWEIFDDVKGKDFSNACGYPVRTVKAFRRRLKEWSKYMPKGTKFILRSRWIGYDVEGVI